ncbi:unnamed protein product [Paramecium pentaurelia]|uniref:Uncharacterized protein n=1 Tax=Paramecium pentaurelia TaxID=43138 RepID=A0A8S1WP78_9CILI|nr:unnamed protein product [Paramecium pentaurelia]
MSIKQVHPTKEKEEQNEFKRDCIRVCSSVQIFNDLRKRRVKAREATQKIFQKLENFSFNFFSQQYQHILQPKVSQFTSQDLIMEEEDVLVLEGFKIKFNRAIRGLLIIMNFLLTFQIRQRKIIQLNNQLQNNKFHFSLTFNLFLENQDRFSYKAGQYIFNTSHSNLSSIINYNKRFKLFQ